MNNFELEFHIKKPVSTLMLLKIMYARDGSGGIKIKLIKRNVPGRMYGPCVDLQTGEWRKDETMKDVTINGMNSSKGRILSKGFFFIKPRCGQCTYGESNGLYKHQRKAYR